MKRGYILHIKIRFFRGLSEINYLDISVAFITHIDTILLLIFNGKVGKCLLLIISTKGAFDASKVPFDATLTAE